MKSSILVLGAALCVAAGFVACGGDDSNGGTNDAGTGQSDSSSDSASGDGDVSDTEAGSDAGTDGTTDAVAADTGPVFVDGSVPDGGSPSTPGTIDCGGKSCNGTNAICCSPGKLDSGVYACSADTDAAACGDGVVQECDETADCPAGNVCCAVVTVGSYVETTCLESCQLRPESRQACKLNGECHNGNPCMPQTCSGQLIGLCSAGGDTCH